MTMPFLYYLEQYGELDIYFDTFVSQQSAVRHAAPLVGRITLIPSQSYLFDLTPKCCALVGEAVNTRIKYLLDQIGNLTHDLLNTRWGSVTNDVDNNWLCTIIIIQLDMLKRLVGVKKKRCQIEHRKTGPALWCAGQKYVLCKTCSVYLNSQE